MSLRSCRGYTRCPNCARLTLFDPGGIVPDGIDCVSCGFVHISEFPYRKAITYSKCGGCFLCDPSIAPTPDESQAFKKLDDLKIIGDFL